MHNHVRHGKSVDVLLKFNTNQLFFLNRILFFLAYTIQHSLHGSYEKSRCAATIVEHDTLLIYFCQVSEQFSDMRRSQNNPKPFVIVGILQKLHIELSERVVIFMGANEGVDVLVNLLNQANKKIFIARQCSVSFDE